MLGVTRMPTSLELAALNSLQMIVSSRGHSFGDHSRSAVDRWLASSTALIPHTYALGSLQKPDGSSM